MRKSLDIGRPCAFKRTAAACAAFCSFNSNFIVRPTLRQPSRDSLTHNSQGKRPRKAIFQPSAGPGTRPSPAEGTIPCQEYQKGVRERSNALTGQTNAGAGRHLSRFPEPGRSGKRSALGPRSYQTERLQRRGLVGEHISALGRALGDHVRVARKRQRINRVRLWGGIELDLTALGAEVGLVESSSGMVLHVPGSGYHVTLFVKDGHLRSHVKHEGTSQYWPDWLDVDLSELAAIWSDPDTPQRVMTSFFTALVERSSAVLDQATFLSRGIAFLMPLASGQASFEDSKDPAALDASALQPVPAADVWPPPPSTAWVGFSAGGRRVRGFIWTTPTGDVHIAPTNALGPTIASALRQAMGPNARLPDGTTEPGRALLRALVRRRRAARIQVPRPIDVDGGGRD